MSGTHKLGLFVLLAAAAALAAALSAQYFEGLSPCALCLIARWPYRVAIVLGVVAMLLPRRPARVALWLGLLCFVADTGVGATQVGVELGWWKSPLAECQAPDLSGLSGAALLAALPAKPVTPCDQPVYPIPGVKFSMAAMSLVYAAAVAALLARLLTDRRLA